MKIAQLLTASTGGIGRHVASIAQAGARGHRVRVFCPEATAVAQGFAELGLDVGPLTALPRAGRADVLHAHGYKAGALALPVARLGRRPRGGHLAQRRPGHGTLRRSRAACCSGWSPGEPI